MQVSWPFKKAEEPPMDPEKKLDPDPTKSNEKSVAEIISESLAPFAQRFDKLQQDIDALKTPAQPARKLEPTERISVLDDEDAAFNQRMTPILQSQLELEARYNRDNVKHEYIDAGFGDFWREHEKRIDAQLLATSLVTPDGQGGVKKLRGDEQYIRNVVNMIMGEAAKSSGVRFDGAKKSFFLEGANSNENAGGSRAPEMDGLTAKQVKLAQRLGIPLDKLKTTVAKLEFTN